MRIVLILSVVLTVSLGVGAECRAGHVHRRCVRSKSCLPKKYAYRRRAPQFASVQTSEAAIPVNFSLSSATPASADQAATSPSVNAGEKRFVLNGVSAGPLRLSQGAAILDSKGNFRFTGDLTHSGGDAGHLRGGKAVIRLNVLAALSPGQTAESAPVAWSVADEFWVNRGQPRTVVIEGAPDESRKLDLSKLTNFRVYLEHYSSR